MIHAAGRSAGATGTAAALVFAAAAFGLACTLLPLYSNDQNTYYLIGLARAGHGLLDGDWLAHTVDPLPVFTSLVALVQAKGHPYLFYLLHFVFCGIYIASLTGIAAETFGIRKGLPEYAVLFAALLAVDSYAVSWLLDAALGFNLREYVVGALPGYYFGPASFGSLLFLSIYFFIRGRRVAAIACLGIASNVHPVYLIASGSLLLAYAGIAWREERNLRAPSLLALLFVVLAAPILLYYGAELRPTTPELWARASAIFTERIPHLDPGRWAGSGTFLLRVAVIAAALYLVRGTPLFLILLVPFALGAVLIGAQLLTGSGALRQLFLNRMPVLVVPVATACAIGWVVARALRSRPLREGRARAAAGGLAVAATLLLAAFGANATRWWFEARARSPLAPLQQFVLEHRRKGDTYAVPPEFRFQDFRLAAGVPVFVDWKSHPRKDVEVVEWRERIRLARRLYGGPEIECGMVPALAAIYGVTHVVVPAGRAGAPCRALEALYTDARFSLYRVVRNVQ